MQKRIPQSFINDLLSRIDIVEIIQARIKLKRTGQNYQAKCPFHTEKSPSFTVSQTKQFYYCFGCQASGNVISFLMQYDRMEFLDALQTLAGQAGLELPQTFEQGSSDVQPLYTLLSNASAFYQQQLRHHPSAIDYLKNRGLTGEIAKQFALGFAPNEWSSLIQAMQHNNALLIKAGLAIQNAKGNVYDRFRQRIIFPIRDVRGRVIGFGGRSLGDEQPKYLNSPETPVFHKGKELYGLYEARQVNPKLAQIIIVEGYMDVISLAQYGFPFAVATLGTATSRQQLQTLLRYTHKIIFCFDGDPAGQNAAWRALTIALPLMRDGITINFLFLPQGEDPDSFVRHAPKQFQQALTDATPLAEFFFQQLQKQTEGNSLADQAAIAKQANDLLSSMPEGVFKELLLEQLGNRLAIEPARLATLLNEQQRPLGNTINAQANRKSFNRSPIRLAIALLLQHPELAANITEIDWLADQELPGITILYNLLKLLQQQPQLTTGTLLEQWRDSKHAATLAKLAAWDVIIPIEGLTEEFLGAVSRIKAQIRSHHIEKLLAKAKQQPLSASEKQQLSQLLAEKREAV